MSRTATSAPQSTKPAPQSNSSVSTEKIAMLAYQKWVKSGCKHGCDKQHWYEAEAELKSQSKK
jgi:Protein of unknown function (DUF2934)